MAINGRIAVTISLARGMDKVKSDSNERFSISYLISVERKKLLCKEEVVDRGTRQSRRRTHESPCAEIILPLFSSVGEGLPSARSAGYVSAASSAIRVDTPGYSLCLGRHLRWKKMISSRFVDFVRHLNKSSLRLTILDDVPGLFHDWREKSTVPTQRRQPRGLLSLSTRKSQIH